MKIIIIFSLLLCASCAAQSEPLPADPFSPDARADAAVDAPLDAVSTDAAQSEPSQDAAAQDAPPPDAGQGLDALPEGGGSDDATPIDAGSDALVDAATDTATDEGSDASVDAAAPDAQADAPGDAAVDSGVMPICAVPSNPACQRAIDRDAQVRAAFPGPCVNTTRMCAGMPTVPVETLPVYCLQEIWRLSGGLSNGGMWVPGHSCSMGCPSGQLCSP
jgi:hypothetical protein